MEIDDENQQLIPWTTFFKQLAAHRKSKDSGQSPKAGSSMQFHKASVTILNEPKDIVCIGIYSVCHSVVDPNRIDLGVELMNQLKSFITSSTWHVLERFKSS
jgi:hypothetical protein